MVTDKYKEKAGKEMELKLIIQPGEYLPLREVVFHTLRDAILTGKLQPGERLMEIPLAEQLGVSRTPVREAIRKLELEGLVIMVPRKGAEVAKITEKQLRDVLEVRKALEELAVRLACERIKEEEIERLEEIHERIKGIIKSGDLVEIVKEDVSFHEIIYNAADNQKLLHLLNKLRQQMYRYRLEYLKNPENCDLVIKEHEAILNAIRQLNVKDAVTSVLQHINNQENGMIMLIEEAQKQE